MVLIGKNQCGRNGSGRNRSEKNGIGFLTRIFGSVGIVNFDDYILYDILRYYGFTAYTYFTKYIIICSV